MWCGVCVVCVWLSGIECEKCVVCGVVVYGDVEGGVMC